MPGRLAARTVSSTFKAAGGRTADSPGGGVCQTFQFHHFYGCRNGGTVRDQHMGLWESERGRHTDSRKDLERVEPLKGKTCDRYL